jgi:hypothetical protein
MRPSARPAAPDCRSGYVDGTWTPPVRLYAANPLGEGNCGSGRYWARTSDPQLVELVLSQLS